MDDLMREMARAALGAARVAAGQVVGDRIAKAHPGLPALEWVGVRWDVAGKQWTAIGDVPPRYVGAEARRVVEAYAAALGGSTPAMAAEGEPELETRFVFDGVEVTVSGNVED